MQLEHGGKALTKNERVSSNNNLIQMEYMTLIQRKKCWDYLEFDVSAMQ